MKNSNRKKEKKKDIIDSRNFMDIILVMNVLTIFSFFIKIMSIFLK